jgi:hypothetical protein
LNLIIFKFVKKDSKMKKHVPHEDKHDHTDGETSDEDEFQGDNKKDQAKKLKAKDYGVIEETQVYEDFLAELFEKVPPGEGDEFAAVKPWLGAIKEPKPKPKENPKAPNEKYEIDWVYGYRSEEAR